MYSKMKKVQKKGCLLIDQVLIFFLKRLQAEARAEFAERSVQKLQKEVDRLEGNIYFITLPNMYFRKFYKMFKKF